MTSKIKTPAIAKPGGVPAIARPTPGILRPPSTGGVKPPAKPSLPDTPVEQKATVVAQPIQKKSGSIDAGEPLAPAVGSVVRLVPKPTQAPPEPPSAGEDSTPSFAVGDRVLVGGTKPGVVAFLGPTQFAPTGVWAGVILDTADGKNDGSLNGVRYFECEANRGVFARPDKVTLVAKAPKTRAQPTQSENAPESEKVFRVGDKVLVDGTKPGTIAFYGATEFAKGEWAGVVLDAPEGKNDGTVAGVRYFTCEPNRGLFAKPQKLVLAPKAEQKPAAVVAPTPASKTAGPAPPSSSSAQASEEAQGGLTVGCRVLVGGTKTGTLRYLGLTEFAKGVWAGVELDEPQGKNDGALSGKRYFQCAPNHGVFSVLGKVELLPTAVDSVTETSMPVAAAPVDPVVTSVPPPAVPPPAVQEVKNSALVRTRSGSLTSSTGPAEGVAISTAQSTSSLAPSMELLQQKELEKMKLEEEVAGLKRRVEDLQFLLEEQGITSGDHLESVAMVTNHTMSSYKQLLEKEQSITASLRQQLEAAKSSSSDVSVITRQLEQERTQALEQKCKWEKALQAAEESFKEQQSKLKGVEEELKLKTESSASTARRLAEVETQLKVVEERTLAQTTASSKLRAELTSLQEQLIGSKQHAADLTKTLADKETELTEIQLALGRANISEAELKHQLTATKDQLHLLSGEKAELEAQVMRMSQLSGDSSSQLGYLNQQLSEKNRQLEELHSRCSQEARQTQEAKDAARLAEGRLTHELEQAKASHSREIKEAQHKLDQLVQELQQLRQESTKTESQLQQSRHEALEAKNQLLSLNEDFKKCELHASSLQTDLEHVKRELKEALKLADDRATLLSVAQEEIRGFEKERQQWSTRESQLTHEISWLESEKQKAIADREKLVVETANASSEHSELAHQRMALLTERDQIMGDLKALQQEHSKVLFEKNQMAKSLSEFKEQAAEQTRDLNSRYSSTQAELTQAQGDIKRLKEELAALKERNEAKQQSMEEQLAMTKVKNADLQHKMEQLTADRDNALQEAHDKLQLVSKEKNSLQESYEQMQHQVTELETQLEETLRSNLDLEMRLESGDLQQKLSETEELLAARDRELTDALEQVKTLSEELVVNQGKRDMEELEEEKKLLEERVKELTVQLEKKEQEIDQQKKLNSKLRTGDKSNGKNQDVGGVMVQLEEAQQLVQDLQLREQSMQETVHTQESQIEFLNSVIADMQHKLETAESLAASLAGVGGTQEVQSYEDEDPENLPPPRMFCDICEVFDQHDTDECPLQVSTAASDSPPPSSAPSKTQRAPGGSNRPYCTNCEIFGHATEDCQYEAMY